MHAAEFPADCPSPIQSRELVTLADGEGGLATRKLIRRRIASGLNMSSEHCQSDAAIIGKLDGRIAITTDSFVVSPLFFPGGDIGTLAVNGTINDLAMAGAVPHALTLSLIVEEGLPLDVLDRVIESVARSSRHVKVAIVSGDTKVVPKGAADKLFLNTTGFGLQNPNASLGIDRLRVGDWLVVSGPIAKHGFAVLNERESLGFNPGPTSDCRPLHRIATDLIDELGSNLRIMRDATRGGVAAVLHELAEDTGLAMLIDETAVPVDATCRGIGELLGIDPLLVANEGTFIAAVDPAVAPAALAVFQRHFQEGEAAVIGEIRKRIASPVIVRRAIGIEQPLDEPVAAMLPRIC